MSVGLRANEKPETRNQKRETRNEKPETRNQKRGIYSSGRYQMLRYRTGVSPTLESQ